MQAIATRAYSAAIVLINVAKQIASVSGQGTVDQEMFMSMLYPAGSNPDDNPFQLLCCNDTCSFTWTGTQHINQVYNYYVLLNKFNATNKKELLTIRCHKYRELTLNLQ